MALLSKFLEDFGFATGIPALGISRTLYSAAILAYIYNVAIPEWKKYKRNKQDNKIDTKKINIDEDEKVEERVRLMSLSSVEEKTKRKPKGPAVNRYLQ